MHILCTCVCRREEKHDETNFLEVDASLAAKRPDIYNMVATGQPTTVVPPATVNKHSNSRAPPVAQYDSKTDDDFVDDPDVPPLI